MGVHGFNLKTILITLGYSLLMITIFSSCQATSTAEYIETPEETEAAQTETVHIMEIEVKETEVFVTETPTTTPYSEISVEQYIHPACSNFTDGTQIFNVPAGTLVVAIHSEKSSCYLLAANNAGLSGLAANERGKIALMNHLGDAAENGILVRDAEVYLRRNSDIVKLGIVLSPTPTEIFLSPMEDFDGDVYPNLYEQIWGSDPLVATTFDELAQLPGAIYAKLRISQPFEVEDMNGWLYQVATDFEIEDKGTNSKGDDHLTFRTVLFPYATFPEELITTYVDSWPIDPTIYPAEVLPYLESTNISNITPEMSEILKEVVKDAATVLGGIRKVFIWNGHNLSVNPAFDKIKYSVAVKMHAGDMFSNRRTAGSTSKSTILTSELRAIGVPTAIVHGIYVTPSLQDRHIHHPQDVSWLNGHWVRMDYEDGINSMGDTMKDTGAGYLVITDFYPDNDDADWTFWRMVSSVRAIHFHEIIDFRINPSGDN